ncbi:MAG: L-threonylcarbamoyladenylate synthase [Chromatiales bacterium]|jgi:tRNA threonylcarbamoyl adenosine modification protein (Sua5/YciO/YrdC/YwlC family)
MSQFFEIHPETPQSRLVRQAVAILQEGGVIVYPTDSCYALGCLIGDKAAMERIRRIRRLDDKHHFTLMCRDLSDISNYSKLDNIAYRLIKTITPGPYTFLLKATHEVPRRLQTPKRKTIGVRIPDHPVAQALLTELGEPMMSTTLIMPDDDMPMTDPYQVRVFLEHHVELVIDGGFCGLEPTTVIDLVDGTPVVARHGKGPVDWLQRH